jgi:hypothetical protein
MISHHFNVDHEICEERRVVRMRFADVATALDFQSPAPRGRLVQGLNIALRMDSIDFSAHLLHGIPEPTTRNACAVHTHLKITPDDRTPRLRRKTRDMLLQNHHKQRSMMTIHVSS